MRRLALAVLVALACIACGGVKAPPGDLVLEFGKHAMVSEVAATQAQRERGLMARTSLSADSGMIFLFPPGKPTGAFWMKDTLIPLSIAFLVRTGTTAYRVISVMDMQPCRTDPCALYSPGRPYDAAVETSLGWYRRLAIGPGTLVRVPKEAPTPY